MARGRPSPERMPLVSDTRERAIERRAIFWSAALVAAIALLGLLFLPAVRLIWIVLLVFAVAAVPQSLAFTRRTRTRRTK